MTESMKIAQRNYVRSQKEKARSERRAQIERILIKVIVGICSLSILISIILLLMMLTDKVNV